DVLKNPVIISERLSKLTSPHATNEEVELLKTTMKNLDFGDIINEVKISDGLIYFENPERLHSFLKIRALMHKCLYLHPLNQTRDKVYRDMLAPLYRRESTNPNDITPQKLRQLDDIG